MITKTLSATSAATFSILLPAPDKAGMPTPVGTGFFISPEGWLVTAAHVVTKNGKSDGEPRNDIDKASLEKEVDFTTGFPCTPMCQFFSLEYINHVFDFALLKVDFDMNKRKEWLKGKDSFPYIQVSKRQLNLGEPVYSFGYPLSSSMTWNIQHATIGATSLSPRTTSAKVSSTLEKTKMIMSPQDPKKYVLDKALNYGNSGGPIVAVDTGNVHAFCSKFQPVYIPQPHLKDTKGHQLFVMIPSLYGIVLSLSNTAILEKFAELGIKVTDI